MSKLTLDQLKSRTWPTQAAAEKDFKRSGIPTHGSDYNLAHVGKTWQVADGAPKFGALMEGGNANPARKKTAAGPKETAARKQRAEAALDVKKPAAKKEAADATPPPAPVLKTDEQFAPVEDDEAKVPLDNLTPEAFTKAMRASLRNKRDADRQPPAPKAKQPEATEAKADEQPAPGPAIDWSMPLPHDGKPYTLALREGKGFPAHATHTWAIEVSRIQRGPVDVLDKDGNLIGTCDSSHLPRAARAPRAASNGVNGASAPTPRAPGKPSEMEAKLIKLAVRKQGVTRADIAREVSDRKLAWTTMIRKLERFGYRYSTTDAPEGSGSRTVYHLDKIDA